MNAGAGLRAAKEALRGEVRTRLREINPALRAEASLVICELTARHPCFAKAECVALFAPLASEPDVLPLIEEAWAQGKRVVLPLMLKQASRMEWHEVAAWEHVVVPGPFGLREPDPLRCPIVPLREIDCALIPGVAFDETGMRLGRGGGYYDCFLAQTGPSFPVTGLMFTVQKCAAIPRESHDRPLRSVITEDGELTF